MKDFIISLALANMVYMEIWERFFYKGNFTVHLPTSNSYLALIIGEILITLVIWSGILLVRRINNKVVTKVTRFVFCLFVISFLYELSKLWENINIHIIEGLFLVVIILLLYLRKMTKVLANVVLLFSPFVIIIFSQAVMGIINDWGKDHVVQTSTPFVMRENSPRVVWFIFDEADQRVMFDKRPPQVNLPAIDRFREEAFQADNAYPPGGTTELSMSSIIDGKIVVKTKGFDDWLQITYQDSNVPLRWGSQPNVFSKVKALKMNNAVFGYLPYSKTINKDVMYCGWSSGTYDYVGSKDTLLANLYAQFYGLLRFNNLNYTQHLIAYKEILNAARNLVANPQYQLVLVHFDVPHLPSIAHYCWRDDSQTPKDYEDNLIIMDQTFSKLREIMESKGIWDNTTVIVSSDHWLRRERYIRDRQVDHRVPFILKLAEQKKNIVYKPAFNTVLTHDLILALLKKEVVTEADLVKWFEQHREIYPLNTRPTK